MSEGSDTTPQRGTEDAPDSAPEAAAVAADRKASRLPKAIVAVALGLLLLMAAVAGGLRYGVLLPQVRLLIEARTDGLKLGRLGQLRIEGLSGDIWRDARVRRLTIRDDQGVWLEARDVRVTWRYLELLRRRFDADLIEAQSVRVLRRPELGPKGVDRGLPLSFKIDALRTRLVLEPAFSYERGVYDVKAALDIARVGARNVQLEADSVLHPGDRLDVDFQMGGIAPLRVVVDAREARGGALAGALGLPAQQAFELAIRANGAVSNGSFTARAVSGSATPLAAKGAWTPSGGQAEGRLSLSASSLTTPLAERLGSEVTFAVTGRKAGEAGYALEARANAEAVQAQVSGVGDIGAQRTGPAGLRVAVTAPSLSRITGGPEMGAATLTGVLRGDAADWRFAGDAAVSGLDLGDYALARVSGPVNLASTKGSIRVQSRVTGAGGRGAGFAAALLGGAPTVAVSAERLANGQLLLRDLDAAGRGLRVQASGGRSLLGGVNLKGRASISNLAAARLGANGAATADWQAAQARTGAPWTLRLDARGQRLAVGMAELDRLLGGAPRVQVQANWQDGRLAVSRATLDGARLDASAAGILQASGALAFKTDWTAEGPVQAGPVEISG
ncbi:MAG: translocation/assembly module TamB, partial [Phenylobacterium sp.]|nr:translocation/assembly module TamB [Phenylobacterium sp.]